MKLNIWVAADEVTFKIEADVITVEEVDVAAEEYFMVDVEKDLVTSQWRHTWRHYKSNYVTRDKINQDTVLTHPDLT